MEWFRLNQAKGLLIGLMALVGLLLIVIMVFLFSAVNADDQQTQKDPKKTISLQAAQKIALGAVEGTLGESEIEQEKNQITYSIEIVNQDTLNEVKIDAKTGQVIGIETEELVLVTPVIETQETKPTVEKRTGPISESEAKQIALEKVPGFVTDVEIEQKFGKQTIVVEIKANSGRETDVIIDMNTGTILGVET